MAHYVKAPAATRPGPDAGGRREGANVDYDRYTVLSLNVRYLPVKFLEICGRVDNVTNANYATAGALNWNAFADPIGVQRFVAPGAPIGGWGGVKVRF